VYNPSNLSLTPVTRYRPILAGVFTLVAVAIFIAFLYQPPLLLFFELALFLFVLHWFRHPPLMFRERHWRFHNGQFFLRMEQSEEHPVEQLSVKFIHRWSVVFSAKANGKWQHEWVLPLGQEAEDLRRWRAVLTIYDAQKESAHET